MRNNFACDPVIAEEDENIATFNSICYEEDILQDYLKEIGKIKLLNSEQEKELDVEYRDVDDLIRESDVIVIARGDLGQAERGPRRAPRTCRQEGSGHAAQARREF